jgi:hypothetical protein
MVNKKVTVLLGMALSFGGISIAQATVATGTTYSSTADNFTGSFAITGFNDTNPNTFSIALTNVSGALDLTVPQAGTVTGERIGDIKLDYTPVTAGYDIVSSKPNWTSTGNSTFTSSDITGSHFLYNFNTSSFSSDGTSVTGGAFTGTASTLNLLLGNMFGTLSSSIGTGSVAVTHTLSANTWTINVTETAVGGTGFAGLFRTLDSVAYGGNNDGRIDGTFLVNGAVTLTTPGTAPGSTPTAPVLPTVTPPVTPGAAPTFTFDNIPVGVNGVGTTTPIWVDPVVAVGYTYELGAGSQNVTSVTLPSLAQVNDANGYQVWTWNGTTYVLAATVAAGGTYTFPAGTTKFQIRDINPVLSLDPANTNAFPVGLTFGGQGTVDLTMTALTLDTGAAVPAPGVLSLLGLGITCLAAVRRRKN